MALLDRNKALRSLVELGQVLMFNPSNCVAACGDGAAKLEAMNVAMRAVKASV